MNLEKGIGELNFADMKLARIFGEGVNNAIEGLSQKWSPEQRRE